MRDIFPMRWGAREETLYMSFCPLKPLHIIVVRWGNGKKLYKQVLPVKPLEYI